MVPDENITFTDGCMGEHTENLLRDCGDFYLRRADGVFAYQLAVVVDDAGWASPKSCAGPTCFPLRRGSSICTGFWVCPHREFAHCPLLLASDGRRLSKRDGDQSLENLRARYTAEDIVGRLAMPTACRKSLHPGRRKASSKTFRGIRCRRRIFVCRKGCLNTETRKDLQVFMKRT